uniref:(northern house mosquito) hypothetical protein n=1 Tax=Culex pipiens TaxID=7175 RepID=A0A8D8MUG2_CULPI
MLALRVHWAEDLAVFLSVSWVLSLGEGRHGNAREWNVRHQAGRFDVRPHLLPGSVHGDRDHRSVLHAGLHGARAGNPVRPVGDLATASESVRIALPNAGTSIHSDRRHHGQHLPDIQAEHPDAGPLHRLDVARADHVLLLRHNAQLAGESERGVRADGGERERAGGQDQSVLEEQTRQGAEAGVGLPRVREPDGDQRRRRAALRRRSERKQLERAEQRRRSLGRYVPLRAAAAQPGPV